MNQFESCSIQTFSLPQDAQNLENLYEIIEKYSDPSYLCSAEITSIHDIQALLEANYISKEVRRKFHPLPAA